MSGTKAVKANTIGLGEYSDGDLLTELYKRHPDIPLLRELSKKDYRQPDGLKNRLERYVIEQQLSALGRVEGAGYADIFGTYDYDVVAEALFDEIDELDKRLSDISPESE